MRKFAVVEKQFQLEKLESGHRKKKNFVKIEFTKKDIRKAQAEAVKEFAGKLKKQIANTMYCRDGYVDYDDTMDVIDELLKEFLEQ